jgi:hypothetical protein
MRDVGKELEGVLHAVQKPLGSNLLKIGRFTGRKLGSLFASPAVRVRNNELEDDAARLGRLVGSFGTHVERLLRTYQKDIVDHQLQLGRIADIGTELYVSACVLNRLDAMLRDHHLSDAEKKTQLETGRYYLRLAHRRMQQWLADTGDNDDEATDKLAKRIMES